MDVNGWRGITRRGAKPLLISLLVLVPCWWQSRIQAGDLSSHIYNSWLATLVERGQAPGLEVRWIWTNALFDIILTSLFRLWGPEAAQRLAVSLCVLVFYWGALRLAQSVHGSVSWQNYVFTAMLAYGWVFHAGFFNYYLGTGLALWALSLLWTPTPLKAAAAAALGLLALFAHALPAAAAAGLGGYILLARRASPKQRFLLLAAGILAIAGLRAFLTHKYHTVDATRLIGLAAGTDQLVVFHIYYALAMIGVLFFWLVMLTRWTETSRLRELAGGVTFQSTVLACAAVALLPDRIDFPQFSHGFACITERLSLFSGVLACVWLGACKLRKGEKAAVLVVAGLYFGLLYRDEAMLNRLEDKTHIALSKVPPLQRVTATTRVDGLHYVFTNHLVDRACIGRCYSYGNYEPSTRQFRVIARGRNAIVADHYPDSWAIQTGEYVVKGGDLPMFALSWCSPGSDEICTRQLRAGERLRPAQPANKP